MKFILTAIFLSIPNMAGAAELFENRYVCVPLAGEKIELRLELQELTRENGEAVASELKMELYGTHKIFQELARSGQPVKGRPDLYKSFWSNDEIVLEAVFPVSSPTRNFTGTFSYLELEKAVPLSCWML